VTYTLTATTPAYEQISDPSGNTITTSANGWQDTIGRNIPGSYALPGFSGDADQGETTDPIPGVPVSPSSTTCPSGTYSAREWIVPSEGSGNTQTYYLCYKQFSFQTAFDLPGNYEQWADAFDVSSTNQGFRPAVLLSNIMLPNNTSYTFTYDQYLSLSSITLPTGASINYTWQNVYFDTSPTSPISRALLTRTVNPGNGEAGRTWHYQYLPNAPNSLPTMAIVTDPEGNDTEYHLDGDQIGSITYYAGCSPDDTTANRTCSGGSTLLKTVSYTLTRYTSGGADGGTPSVFSSWEPTTTTVTWSTGGGSSLVSKNVTTMTPSYGTCDTWSNFDQMDASGAPLQPTQSPQTPCYSTNQPQSVAYYDLGSGAPGSLLKTVTTNYEWQSSSAYLNANFLNLPSSIETTDGLGNKAAETDYYYDQSPSPSGAYGNLTSTATWLSGSSFTTTTTSYNSQGMPISVTDGNSKTTTIAYDSTGAFPQTVTHPSTVGGSHVDGYVYDSNTGLLTSHTDWNGKTTTYSYGSLNRLSQITFPQTTDGTTGNAGYGYVNYTYTDTPGSLAVTEKALQSTNNTLVTQTEKFDGLGEVLHALTTSDPDGADTVDTTYDLMGRVASVTNPYRSTSDPTYGVTSYTYDALGRKVIQTEPDGSILQWCYDDIATSGQSNCHANESSKTGVWVDAADETGHDWQRVSNGLSNLIAVVEPGALETDYQYDALNDLTRVDQWGGANGSSGDRVRTFAYNGASWLVDACNPESIPAGSTCSASGPWSATYAYDGNGNVTTKTTQAINASSGTQTLGYCYDALNRMTYKFYTGSFNCASPSGYADSYTYDTSSITGASNTNGKLTNETAIDNGVVVSERSPYEYDAMGRVLALDECDISNCSGTQYQLNYTYDLAGNVTSSNNGVSSQPAQFTMSYDTANRLSKVTSSWTQDSTHPQILFQANSTNPASYGPAGLMNAQLGINTQTNQPALTMTRTYDNRMRILSENDGNGGADSTGSISISGSEQSKTNAATSGTGSVTIGGSERQTTYRVVCGPGPTYCWEPMYDTGTVTITINGTAYSTTYGGSSTSGSLASSLASLISQGSLAAATVSGSTVNITAKTTGTASNYTLSASSATTNTQYFSGSSFSATPSGSTLTGGTNSSTLYDSGTVTATLDSCSGNYSYGQSSTTSTIASGLASALSSSCGSIVTASSSGSTVSLTSKSIGSGNNWPISTSVTYNSSKFSSASFSESPSGMSGGENANDYSYSIATSGGYATNGNILHATDSVTGEWEYSYDNLNRLTTGAGISGTYNGIPVSGVNLGWSYDPFGNLGGQTSNSGNFPTFWSHYQAGNNNQASSTSFATGGVNHDAAGDIEFDGRNSYLYDAEGRVCAVSNQSMDAEYLYDADGNLAATGSTSSLSCNPASDGFSITNSYVRGLNGEQVSETNGAGHWYHTNVFANGQLLATYGASETFFALNNWLGTKRAEVTPDGDLTTFASLPFGDDLTTATIVGSQPDATEQHFTGKELDSRSGNETFKYRDYASSVGRWLTPDPSGLTYADPTNPQSLDLYSYVQGNPLVLVDPSGLWLVLKCGADTGSYTEYKTPNGHGVYQQTAEVDAGKCSVIDDGRGRYNGFIPQVPQVRKSIHLTSINCPRIPPHPQSADVDANVRLTEAEKLADKARAWARFINRVRPGGAWDYKALPGGYPKWDDFGNFNYGATGAVLTNSLKTLEQGAAMARFSVRPLAEMKYGSPFKGPNYGNDPHKNDMIRQGMQYENYDCGDF
jgi:RHS repeat-associated protein